jgi:hypothetical protein
LIFKGLVGEVCAKRMEKNGKKMLNITRMMEQGVRKGDGRTSILSGRERNNYR